MGRTVSSYCIAPLFIRDVDGTETALKSREDRDLTTKRSQNPGKKFGLWWRSITLLDKMPVINPRETFFVFFVASQVVCILTS